MTGPVEPPDTRQWRPGSQAERTAMAWMRTALSVFVSAGAAVRLAALDDLLAVEAVAGLGVLAGLLSIILWWHRFRRLGELPGVASERILASSAAVTSAVVAVCSVGFAVTSLAGWALLG